MRINLYGGPGVGKSTLAAVAYAWLQQHDYSAELVREWVKVWAYRGRRIKPFDYVYTFANQLHAEDRLLQEGVEILVTDSPVYLQCMYAAKHQMRAASELRYIAKWFEETYPSVNFFVDRAQFAVYEQAGRYEDLGAAMEMDQYILTCLQAWHIPFDRISPHSKPCDWLSPRIKQERKRV